MDLLKIKNLKKNYLSPDGETQPVIDIPYFSMQAGEQMALRGESGSGKTTFLSLIAGILQADTGKIIIDGKEITSLSESRRDRFRGQNLGFVFQTFNLLQGFTALENVLLGMSFGIGANKNRAEELLARVGLSDRKNYKPKQLSVGQQQRVAVARALANHPKLVLADEPTGNLDRRHAFEALELIREICLENDTSLLLVSHDPGILEYFEKVEGLANINRV